jgi:hypothetical protein
MIGIWLEYDWNMIGIWLDALRFSIFYGMLMTCHKSSYGPYGQKLTHFGDIRWSPGPRSQGHGHGDDSWAGGPRGVTSIPKWEASPAAERGWTTDTQLFQWFCMFSGENHWKPILRPRSVIVPQMKPHKLCPRNRVQNSGSFQLQAS